MGYLWIMEGEQIMGIVKLILGLLLAAFLVVVVIASGIFAPIVIGAIIGIYLAVAKKK